MGVAQKPRSWPRWVNFTPALVGHFYIGGDIYSRTGRMHPDGLEKNVRLLFVFGDQLSHFSLSEENKICLLMVFTMSKKTFKERGE